MFYIVEIAGCEPYVNIMTEDANGGEALHFNTEEEAKAYAKKNCAWEYQIVNF